MASSSKALVAPPKKVVTLVTIDPDNETSSMLVKVLRKWQVFSRNGGNTPMATELVLANSEGTKIQGHIDRMHIYKHDRYLHEGHVYTLFKFVVALNAGLYRATRHNYKLNIKLNTIVCPATRGDLVPDPEFVFTPPAECFEKEFNRDYLVDVAGILIGVGPECEFNRGNGKSSRMKIDLDNRAW